MKLHWYAKKYNNYFLKMLALKVPEAYEFVLKHICNNMDDKQITKLILTPDWNGQTLLHKAAESGLIKPIVSTVLLVPQKVVLELLHSKDKLLGNTALHTAVMCKQAEVVRILATSEEVDVDMQNNKGDTALHIALRLVCNIIFINPNFCRKLFPLPSCS